MSIAIDMMDSWEMLSAKDRLSVLLRLRSLITGNQNEKLKVLNNKSHLNKLIEILKDPTVELELLEITSTIFASLTSLAVPERSVLKNITQDPSIISVLLNNSTTNSRHLEINVTTLLNLLGYKPNLICERDRPALNMYFQVVNDLLRRDSDTSNTVLHKALTLIYYLSVSEAIVLLHPILMRISSEVKPIYKFITKNNVITPEFLEANYFKEVAYPKSEVRINSELLSGLIFTAAYLLSSKSAVTKKHVKLSLPKEFLVCITSLTRSDDYQLRVSSINFVVNYLSVGEPMSNRNKKVGYCTKMLPSLYDAIDLEFYTIYHTVSVQDFPASFVNIFYPKSEMTPFHIMNRLARDYSELIQQMVDSNLIVRFVYMLGEHDMNLKPVYEFEYENNHDSSKLRYFTCYKLHKNNKSVQMLSQCFLSLSVIGSYNDNYKNEIIHQQKLLSKDLPEESHMNVLLIEILKQYCFYLDEFELFLETFKKEGLSSVKKEAFVNLINLMNDDMFTNILYLIRSLSRSVALLRTFFVTQLQIVKLLIKIVKFKYKKNILISLSIVLNIDLSFISTIMNKQVLIKSVTLGIIANAILDFSSIREDFDRENFIGIIRSYLIQSSEPDNQEIDTSQNDKTVLLNCFSILRNSFYNEDDTHKKLVIDEIPLSIIFEHIIDNDSSKIQTTCFNILRNLSCSSHYFSDLIPLQFENFIDMKNQSGFSYPFKDFWELLQYKLTIGIRTSNSEMLVALTYIIDHIVATTDQNKDKVINQNVLLTVLNSALKDPETSFDVKLAIVWVLINLTWQDSTSSGLEVESESNDAMEIDDDNTRSGYIATSCLKRAEILKSVGFIDSLKKLIRELSSQSPNMDLLARCKTADFQLSNLLKAEDI